MNIRAKTAFDHIKKANESIVLIENLTATLEKSDSTRIELQDLTKGQKKELKKLELLFLDDDKLKGIQRNPKSLRAIQGTARRYVNSSYATPGPNAKIAVDKAKRALEEIVSQVESYMVGDWKEYQEKVEKMDFRIFR